MTYIIASKIRKLCHDSRKQITAEALTSIDKKVEDFLYKVIRPTNGNHRIVPEVVALVRL